MRDVTFRLAPISRADAFEMLAELRGAALLDGVRGRPPIDRAALADLLLTVAGEGGLALQTANGEILEELDLNPVFAYPDGAVVADARIVYAKTLTLTGAASDAPTVGPWGSRGPMGPEVGSPADSPEDWPGLAPPVAALTFVATDGVRGAFVRAVMC
jgi:hypothetical protein